MDNTFIQVILTILTVSVLWGAYELYRLRQWLKDFAIESHEAAIEAITPQPQLFDQDADHA